jgi:hypothetical protein
MVAWGRVLEPPRGSATGSQDAISARQGRRGRELRSYLDPDLDQVHLVAFASIIIAAGIPAAIFTPAAFCSIGWLMIPILESGFGLWAIQLSMLSRFTHPPRAPVLRVRRVLVCLGGAGGGLALLLAAGQAAVGIHMFDCPLSFYVTLAAGGVGVLSVEAEVFIEWLSTRVRKPS